MGKAERIATGTEDICPTVLDRRTPTAASRTSTDDGRLVSLTSKCHRKAGVKLWFRGSDGRMFVQCAKCSAAVAWLQIANGAPE